MYAVSRVVEVDDAEIVATVASKSAGPGTRQNIDEFTQTTASAVEVLGRAEHGKAIIILNPADPPLMMRDTIFCLIPADADTATSDDVSMTPAPAFTARRVAPPVADAAMWLAA